jgi:deazaflavin-dependent oxidoreductase (nitroreductase family)
MAIQGDYEPSTMEWVATQVAEYEASGGQRANTLRDTGIPIIVVTVRGATSGKVRKFALMRVEHEGAYALVGSRGGAPEHPSWVFNVRAHPDELTIQDGPAPAHFTTREVDGDEKARWWERAVAVYPPYADYQAATSRVIPVFVATPSAS